MSASVVDREGGPYPAAGVLERLALRELHVASEWKLGGGAGPLDHVGSS
jgi:hypothetical protein